MPNIISSKEDQSSALYKGRASFSAIADSVGMKSDDWRARLAQAVAASGKSARAISLSAGMGPGYVHSLLIENKDPTVSNLIKICEALGVSMSSVLYGFEVSAETEELLALLEKGTSEERDGLLKMLRARRSA